MIPSGVHHAFRGELNFRNSHVGSANHYFWLQVRRRAHLNNSWPSEDAQVDPRYGQRVAVDLPVLADRAQDRQRLHVGEVVQELLAQRVAQNARPVGSPDLIQLRQWEAVLHAAVVVEEAVAVAQVEELLANDALEGGPDLGASCASFGHAADEEVHVSHIVVYETKLVNDALVHQMEEVTPAGDSADQLARL